LPKQFHKESEEDAKLRGELQEEFGQKVVFLIDEGGKQRKEIAEAIGLRDGNLRNYLIKRIRASGKQLTKMLNALNAAFPGLLKRFVFDPGRKYTDYIDNPPRVIADPPGEEYKGLKSRIEDLEHRDKGQDKEIENLKAEVETLKAALAQRNNPQ